MTDVVMLQGSVISESDGTCCNGSSLAVKNNIIASDSSHPASMTEPVVSCSCSTNSHFADTAAAATATADDDDDDDDDDDGCSQLGGKQQDTELATQCGHAVMICQKEEVRLINEQMIQQFNKQIEVLLLFCLWCVTP